MITHIDFYKTLEAKRLMSNNTYSVAACRYEELSIREPFSEIDSIVFNGTTVTFTGNFTLSTTVDPDYDDSMYKKSSGWSYTYDGYYIYFLVDEGVTVDQTSEATYKLLNFTVENGKTTVIASFFNGKVLDAADISVGGGMIDPPIKPPVDSGDDPPSGGGEVDDTISADWLIRKPNCRIYNGTTLYDSNSLIDCDIERIADATKFFGQVVCQRLHFTLIDIDRSVEVKAGDRLTVYISANGDESGVEFPRFYVSEVHRDETSNKISVTAYDLIKSLENVTLEAISLPESFTVDRLLSIIRPVMGAYNVLKSGTIPNIDKVYTRSKINCEDNFSLKDLLIAIAEITGTVIFMDGLNLHVKSLPQIETRRVISNNDYINLTSKANRRLVKIISATELGDNLEVHTSLTGSTQVLWENPMINLLSDSERVDIITNLLNVLGNFTIGQYDMKWFGDPTLRVGDKLSILCKDGTYLTTYLLDDKITFNGALREDSQWEYQDPEDIDANPSTITDALSKTTARVDKVNQEIELTVQHISELGSQLSNILMTLDGITSTVERIDRREVDNQGRTDREIEEIKKWTQIAQTAEDVQILINQAISTMGEVDHVTTTTGFTFNADGLHIQKSTSDISTTIDNDGMTIEQNGKDLLIADHNGVMASDLTARNYLQIAHSRFQHYKCKDKDHRTGLFYWRGEDL